MTSYSAKFMQHHHFLLKSKQSAIHNTHQSQHSKMMSNLLTILGFLFLWTATHWIVSQLLWRIKRAPPGPLPLPIIGNLFSFGKKPHISLAKLAESYGPLISLRLGFLTVVVASSPAVAREILLRKDTSLSSRFVGDAIRAFNHNEHAISSLPVGDRWRTLRKIMTVELLSNRSMEAKQSIRREKIRDLVSYINGCVGSGTAVKISQITFDTALNSLSNTFFSVDLADPDSKLCREFKQTMWDLMHDAGRTNLADLFPALKIVDPQGIRRRMEIHFRKLFELFDGIVSKRLEERKEGLEERGDVLDGLLKICTDKTDDLELAQVPRLLLELFGGPEPASVTVEWAMTELLRSPSKMKKAKAELELVIGKGNFVEESDIVQLPYFKAVLNESFRLHPPFPFLVPRKADRDTEVSGFVVPNGAQVLVNLWAIGRDPNVWKDPLSFEPERFLDLDIDVKGHHMELIPLGAGRRMCVGASLGITMIQSMLANLLHSFEWKLEDGVEPGNLDMEESFGIGVHKVKPLYAIPMNSLGCQDKTFKTS